MAVLEICVDSVASAVAAQQGGAGRIELCSDLLEGGITPGPGLISVVRSRLEIDIFVMIRPRAGDFSYSQEEIEVMQRDIDEARRLGADGFVLGILDDHGRIDVERTRELVKRAYPLPVTFHRAIDMTPDPLAALDEVIMTGAKRVLSSGGAPSAIKGLELLQKMCEAAGDRIVIMAGSGLTLKTIQRVVKATSIREYHASLRKAIQSPVEYHKRGFAMGDLRDREYVRYATYEQDVRAMVNSLARYSPAHASQNAREM